MGFSSSMDNWPTMLPGELIPVIMAIDEHITPFYTSLYYTQGLNHRLGTEGKMLPEIAYI